MTEATTPPPPGAATAPPAETAAAPPALSGRPVRLFGLWTALLVAGYAIVVLLGRPLPTTADQLAAAYAPPTPVSEAVARESAATIVRLEFPEFTGTEPAVERRTDFGVERFVIVYSDPEEAAALRISILVDTGKVDVSSFN